MWRTTQVPQTHFSGYDMTKVTVTTADEVTKGGTLKNYSDIPQSVTCPTFSKSAGFQLCNIKTFAKITVIMSLRMTSLLLTSVILHHLQSAEVPTRWMQTAPGHELFRILYTIILNKTLLNAKYSNMEERKSIPQWCQDIPPMLFEHTHMSNNKGRNYDYRHNVFIHLYLCFQSHKNYIDYILYRSIQM